MLSHSTYYKLVQTQLVGEFYTKLIALANCVHGVSSYALLDCSISGLEPDTRHDFPAHSPSTSPKFFLLQSYLKRNIIPNTNPQTLHSLKP
jgi:hypothetical protein